jgi:hypothetical protein
VDDKAFWLGVRRALLEVVRMIERRYDLPVSKRSTHG